MQSIPGLDSVAASSSGSVDSNRGHAAHHDHPNNAVQNGWQNACTSALALSIALHSDWLKYKSLAPLYFTGQTECDIYIPAQSTRYARAVLLKQGCGQQQRGAATGIELEICHYLEEEDGGKSGGRARTPTEGCTA